MGVGKVRKRNEGVTRGVGKWSNGEKRSNEVALREYPWSKTSKESKE